MGIFSDIGDWFQDTLWDPIKDSRDYWSGKTATDTANAIAQQEAALSRDFEETSAEKAMKFSGEEAEKARAFSGQMSSTAVSRIVEDAKKAGINPYYLIQGGAQASTPGSPSGSGFSARGHMAPIKNTGELMAGRMATAWQVFRGARMLGSELAKLKGEARVSKTKGDVFENVGKMLNPMLKMSGKGWASLFEMFTKKPWKGGFSGRKPRKKRKLLSDIDKSLPTTPSWLP